MKLKRITLLRVIICIGAVVLLTQQALGGISFAAEGTSAKGVDVRFEAELSILGDILTIDLTNHSPQASLNPDDLLASFYFDIVNGDGVRPDMTYISATGDTYKGVKNGPDTLIESGANLQALAAGDNSWQFKPINADYIPNLGFGIGTVGNSNLFPNGFDGNIVDGADFAIYTGEITTQPLTNPDVLVKDTATFIFSGVSGFEESDIVDAFAFGLGTAPDSLLTPEPATLALLGLGGLLLRRKR